MFQLREDTHLEDIDQAIDETEKQIDAQLDLIEQLETSGKDKEDAIDAFMALLDKLDQIGDQRLEIVRAMDQ